MERKVSIVIPVYNVEKYIGRCLLSVIGQTYKAGIECIVVDDCSPDNSCAVIKDIISGLDENVNKIQIKLIHHKQNRGVSEARNTGIKHATGEWLYFLDGDDELYPETVELLVSALLRTDAQMSTGGYTILKEDRRRHDVLYMEQILSGEENIVLALSTGRWNQMAWNKLVKRSFVIDNNLFFFKDMIHEDELWTFNSLFKLKSLAVIGESTYKYREREGSIMKTVTPVEREGYVIFLEEGGAALSKNGGGKALRHHFMQWYFYTAVTLIADDAISLRIGYRFYKRIAAVNIAGYSCLNLLPHQQTALLFLRWNNTIGFLGLRLIYWWHNLRCFLRL